MSALCIADFLLLYCVMSLLLAGVRAWMWCLFSRLYWERPSYERDHNKKVLVQRLVCRTKKQKNWSASLLYTHEVKSVFFSFYSGVTPNSHLVTYSIQNLFHVPLCHKHQGLSLNTVILHFLLHYIHLTPVVTSQIRILHKQHNVKFIKYNILLIYC